MRSTKGTKKAGSRYAESEGYGTMVVHDPVATYGSSASRLTPSKIVERIRVGLPVREARLLQEALGVAAERMPQLLGISKATFHRRQAGELLEPAESDRVVRFARLLSLATQVFESQDAARQWLSAPQIGLGGETPLEFAQTEVGAREVERLLGRIEHGVYS